MDLVLSDSLTEQHRRLPARCGSHRPVKVISRERFYNWALRYENQARQTQALEGDLGLPPAWLPLTSCPRPLHPHQTTVLAATHRATCNFASHRQQSGRTPRHGRRQRAAARGDADDDENRALARSTIRLPGDGSRQRPPSLERQEAFSDARTAKKRQRAAAEDDTAELYRLGLLYDNEHERGSGFGLDAIVHDEPIYAVRVRRSKRQARKTDNRKTAAASFSPLLLQLSMAGLADNDAIARFLTRPDADNAAAPAEHGAARPLTPTIIYELESNSTSSLRDTTTADLPDLIFSDSDDDVETGDGWAVLQDSDVNDHDTHNDGEDDSEPASPNDYVWIMLR